jgi:hypothetical protein
MHRLRANDRIALSLAADDYPIGVKVRGWSVLPTLASPVFFSVVSLLNPLQKVVILRMMTYPKPDDLPTSHNPQRPVT